MQLHTRILDHLKLRSEDSSEKTVVADQFRSATYRTFYQEILLKAAGLQQAGVTQEDRVLLVLEHGIDHLTCYFACMYIGAIPVNLSVAKPVSGILQAGEIVSARFCILDGYPHSFESNQFTVLEYHAIRDNGQPAVPGYCDIAYMMFTSGTTGTPKAVMTSHANTMATALSIVDFTGMTADAHELISLPLAFTFGLGHFHALILKGGSAFLTNRRYDTGYLAEAICTQRTNGFLASPAMLREMVSTHRDALIRCKSVLRYLVVNCTPMESELTAQLLELLPDTAIYMYYGMTEASRCAYIHYNQNRHRLDFTGKHCLNVELRIDQPDHSGLGEICMRGPNVMPGYWNNPEATQQTIYPEGWIHSGDLGIMDEDGYIKVIGRINDQISVDGMKCQPAEVERIICELDFVQRATVCGLSDPDKFQIVAAAIIPAACGLPDDFHAQVRAHCQARLEPFKVPVIIEAVEYFPANELGKVNRKELAQLLTAQSLSI